MRDKKRIKRILKLIEKAWLKNPDLRLCQFICNCYPRVDDLYYVEDESIELKLKEIYNVK